MEKLKNKDKISRDTIINSIKDIIMDYDPELTDRHVIDFPLAKKRRWYDTDPYSWLAINTLEYANEELIKIIIIYLNKKL